MISPSAPRFAVTRVIGEGRRSATELNAAGAVRLVRPVRLEPWVRFGHAIQEGKASLQHGANRISSHVGDVAQAQVANIAGAMLSLSIGGVLVDRRALRHNAVATSCVVLSQRSKDNGYQKAAPSGAA
jgi:hypothetical protein